MAGELGKFNANEIAASFPEDFVRSYTFPPDFNLTFEMRRFALEHGLDPDVEFHSFLCECIAADKNYADWTAAWRYWVLTMQEACEIEREKSRSRVLYIRGLLAERDDSVGEITSLEEDRLETSQERDQFKKELEAARAELTRIRRSIGTAYGQARSAELSSRRTQE